jgi:ubiquinone/menaquinone biosynthesis C-methylase UbiE
MKLDSNPLTPTWRHIVRTSELGWLIDHKIQNNILFPGAGYICMAIEAARQHCSSDNPITGYRLRDVKLLKGLVIPESQEGVELQIQLLRASNELNSKSTWRQFEVYSVSHDDNWALHSTGQISVETQFNCSETETGHYGGLEKDGESMQVEDLYKRLQAVGVSHGPSFQNLKDIIYCPGSSSSVFGISDVDTLTRFKYQYGHIVHPTTLDSIFQAAYSALSPSAPEWDTGMVPQSIDNLFISAQLSNKAGDLLVARSKLQNLNNRGFDTAIDVFNGSDPREALIRIDNLHCQSIGRTLLQPLRTRKQAFSTTWEHDLSFMTPDQLKQPIQFFANERESQIIQDLKLASQVFIQRALASLTTSDMEALAPHHLKLCNWMKTQEKSWVSENSDFITSTSSGAETLDQQRLIDSVRDGSVNGKILCRIGENLAEIMRGQISLSALLLEDKLLYDYYEKALRIDRSYKQVKHLVGLVAQKNPSAKILEIGAGAGGCTASVLEALGSPARPQFSQYDFTDVSPGFFEAAKDRFSEWESMINYRRFDVEIDPTSQGLEAGSYDLIIACQVLHATSEIVNTLANVRKLLKPGGRLIFVETTRDTIDIQLVFGVMPGWWLSRFTHIFTSNVLLTLQAPKPKGP